MTDNELLDIYSDYRISAFGLTTAAGLAMVRDGPISHDWIQRFLAAKPRTSADLWRVVKPHVRAIQRDDGVRILADSIAEKPSTDEHDLGCWHDDHAKDRTVKDSNFLTALEHGRAVSLPIGVTLIATTEHYKDKKAGKQKWRSPVGKNEDYRSMIQQAVTNQIPFSYVLNDVWFASAENMRLVKHSSERDLSMPIKAKRKLALRCAEKQQRQDVRVTTLELQPPTVQEVYFEGVAFPRRLLKQLFAPEDGSSGVQSLVTSDPTRGYDDVPASYRTRWSVEPYHKSLKPNASWEQAPTQTVTTQTNPVFGAVYGSIKLELLKGTTKLNHVALKSKLYLRALHVAFETLRTLQPVRLAA